MKIIFLFISSIYNTMQWILWRNRHLHNWMKSYGMNDRDKKALEQFDSGEFCYSFQKKIIVNAIFSFWSVNPQAMASSNKQIQYGCTTISKISALLLRFPCWEVYAVGEVNNWCPLFTCFESSWPTLFWCQKWKRRKRMRWRREK